MKIYGKPQPSKEFLSSIETHGLLQPITINDYRDGSYEIIVGNTRAVAWRMLWEQGRVKSAWIPCRIVHLSSIEAEQLIIESNRQREKTKGQKVRETTELLRIYTAVQDAKTAMARIAKETKQGLRTVSKQATIGFVAENRRDTVARRVLADLDNDKISVSAAYREVCPQKKTLKNSPLGNQVTALETLARKLPGGVRDPANNELRDEAIRRIRAAGTILSTIGITEQPNVS